MENNRSEITAKKTLRLRKASLNDGNASVLSFFVLNKKKKKKKLHIKCLCQQEIKKNNVIRNREKVLTTLRKAYIYTIWKQRKNYFILRLEQHNLKNYVNI